MSPLIHNRYFPEIQSANLLNHELRILIDPKSVKSKTFKDLLDLDVLRCYLRDIPDSPCRIFVLLPDQHDDKLNVEYDFLRRLGAEVLPIETIIIPQVEKAFTILPKKTNEDLGVASTAYIGNADIVAVGDEETVKRLSEAYKKLSIAVEDLRAVKKSCEIFVRGHEIPWIFFRSYVELPLDNFLYVN